MIRKAIFPLCALALYAATRVLQSYLGSRDVAYLCVAIAGSLGLVGYGLISTDSKIYTFAIAAPLVFLSILLALRLYAAIPLGNTAIVVGTAIAAIFSLGYVGLRHGSRGKRH